MTGRKLLVSGLNSLMTTAKEIKVDAEALCKRWRICGGIVCAHRSRDFTYFRASIRIISVV